MWGPFWNLDMPVEVGMEGEDDSFREAEYHQLHSKPDQLLPGPLGGEERHLKKKK